MAIEEISPTSTQWVYSFRNADPKRIDLLGGKGANLAGMTSLGLPVPAGFTITTEACLAYNRNGKEFPEGLWEQVRDAIRELEAAIGHYLGDPSNPVLVSVRSGAAVSMPGMMDTVLNLGINQEVAEGIAAQTDNERFALDIYRRFIQMFGNVVFGIESSKFDSIMNEQQRKAGVSRASELGAADLREVIPAFKRMFEDEAGSPVPDDPYTQLEQAIRAVFDSWNTRRAIDYRDYHGISHDLGTAVNVVVMVFGNVDDSSGTGVMFTRDPATGEKTMYGEYLVNAQGEDVVAGIATPQKLDFLSKEMPRVYKRLTDIGERLERRYLDAQDVEFTIEQGRLYMLQTRVAKRSAKAAVKIAVDMAQEGHISREEALLRVEPEQIYQLLLPRLDDKAKEQAQKDGKLLGTGLGASPGGATGKVVFTADAASEMGGRGESVILARPETSAEDVHGMLASKGVLTSRGGTTSHAAVVARGVGKPCVTGAESIEVNPEEGYLQCDGVIVREGDEISIDGVSGQVFIGAISTVQPNPSEESELITLLEWADDAKKLGVWANADYPRDAEVAVEFGAEGIGLCRTEHMFFETERLEIMRQAILTAHASGQKPDDEGLMAQYKEHLERLEVHQVSDFEGLFRAMAGKSVVIRLLDPPLNEFMPSHDELLVEVVELRIRGDDDALLAEKETLLAAVSDMRESNPMLGLRGCRLGLMYPDIYAMQARAIATAASNVSADGIEVHPEIMVPLVGHKNEMALLRENLEKSINEVLERTGANIDYTIGTMIEIPRAALTADEIAEFAEFFSFGTNDLTQTTFGYSRDDAEGKFLMRYVEDGILPEDPFSVLDIKGVGELIRIASDLGRRTRPNIKMGICGEHGGDPASIAFCHEVGLDYVSCSPYRVPVARLAAAQAALRDERRKERKVIARIVN